jgi:Amt family ammonium transporter
VYVPICHWVRGEGWLYQLGVMDFAGGVDPYANVGVAVLAAALFVGK